MSVFTLADTTGLEKVAIRVKDRDKMISFYRDLIGFALKGEENALAIMATKEDKKEHLWLEESPRADDHFGEIKKLDRCILKLTSVAEFSDLFRRLKEKDYPIQQLDFKKGIHLVLVDPEENQLEIMVEDANGVNNEKDLLALAENKYLTLSKDSLVHTIHLNVNDSKEAAFLQKVLGFQKDPRDTDHYYLKDIDFDVFLHNSDSRAIKVDSTDILGLEILCFVVSEKGIAAIEHYLTETKQQYYMDKKKTILTIYDPLGIEWWFVRQK